MTDSPSCIAILTDRIYEKLKNNNFSPRIYLSFRHNYRLQYIQQVLNQNFIIHEIFWIMSSPSSLLYCKSCRSKMPKNAISSAMFQKSNSYFSFQPIYQLDFFHQYINCQLCRCIVLFNQKITYETQTPKCAISNDFLRCLNYFRRNIPPSRFQSTIVSCSRSICN